MSTKSFFVIFLLLISAVLCSSCKTSEQKIKNQNDKFLRENEQSKMNEKKDNFSHNTIIVYLESETSEEEIQAISEKYNLKVLYIYKNFLSCALSSKKTLTEKELNSLIKKVENEPHVLSVQKDYIMNLDSNDF